MGDFKLSASLQAHAGDVRAVAFPAPGTIYSASRDCTVRQWTKAAHVWDDKIIVQSPQPINSLTSLPSSTRYPSGLIASGGSDSLIDVRQPGQTLDQSGILLAGHANNVCFLSSTVTGNALLSGSWDTQARRWDIDKAETVTSYDGHDAAVWTILDYDENTVITACADRHIRIFSSAGKLIRRLPALPDVPRALCKLPDGHQSGAAFASAGNDQIIRLWTINGVEMAQLHGHESYIYSLALLPNGDLVTTSEDRTARIWRGNECIQTITHPAISVWALAVCQETGDIVTGASDHTVRIFSRAAERHASAEALSTFDEAVRSSAVPAQTVGDGNGINIENLPGPEFLQQKSGTREGQDQLIKEEDGSVSLYNWSTAAQQWLKVGTVVTDAGSSGVKVSHEGKDYDYVFDVDIEDGKPPLKLPYNLGQNPYDVAQKFVASNELPVTYLDQVANFIMSNTKGTTLGPSSNPPMGGPGSDPWGTESRYRPGEAGQSEPRADKEARVLPQNGYLDMRAADLAAIRRKIIALNDEASVKLSNEEMKHIETLLDRIKSVSQNPKPQADQISSVFRMVTEWEPAQRLPAIDVLRLCAVSPDFVRHTSSGNETIVDILARLGIFDPDADKPNNTMLAARLLGNLFISEQGRTIMDGCVEQVIDLLLPFASTDKANLSTALATVSLNYAVLVASSPAAADSASKKVQAAKIVELAWRLSESHCTGSSVESETLYRALIAIGTLLTIGAEYRAELKRERNLSRLLQTIEAGPAGKEPRFKRVLSEMKDELA